MSQYLPNLRRLDLKESRKLEKIIDFGQFPNLEWLNLEECINLVELDPSIGLLRKLVYLNVKNCKNLVSIPNNIFRLSSLEDLNMHGCSKAFNNSRILLSESVLKWIMVLTPTENTYSLPSLGSLYCLRDVDISFCRLSQVPDTIECLHWLEKLNLGGNDFVTLPSLKKLFRLVYLNLEHCRVLESLPQLPSPATIGRDHRKNKDDWTIGLIIFNCPKLSERERCSSMTFSWMIQFIQANPQPYFERTQIVTPGSEIPSWINNKSTDSSIQIDESPIMHDNNNNIIGFVCCVVFSLAPQDSTMMGLYPAWVNIRGIINLQIPVMIKGSLITTKSSHLWMIYLPRESYDKFEKIQFKIIGGESLGMEVKSCGYRWVCKQDLQEFNFTMMNHEMMNHEISLARNRKILAIEDETQKPKSFLDLVYDLKEFFNCN